jgi:hypothetical protein
MELPVRRRFSLLMEVATQEQYKLAILKRNLARLSNT